jgi:hypothetical protein
LRLLTEKRTAKNGGLKDGQKDTVEEDRNYLERSHEAANWLASQQKNWHLVTCVENGSMRTREDIQAEVQSVVKKVL